MRNRELRTRCVGHCPRNFISVSPFSGAYIRIIREKKNHYIYRRYIIHKSPLYLLADVNLLIITRQFFFFLT